MYTNTNKKYQYSYRDSQTSHHHDYIIPALMEMISETAAAVVENKQKPRILDIGCGNGSLSNLIAQHGYEVVGVEESVSGVQLTYLLFPTASLFKVAFIIFPMQK
ncbi:methyltransferase domain-containing protein [Nodularia spumigena]|uniref:Methyltransferase domain-containing protein n=1 Tax=Nodularia spumigena UHCC 0060 TaxID=3110300 RepID=A0ABU5UXQ0_NODSP|nr:methyltransferase domain-containing protein [Nodularia spumigena]MEA5526351.1 methyltransferase domain-containing protein [Nodularia spumigena UHCC 0143]MEA5611089.1 methyltransferase domain-containing protein [Nodularia spumigena UHCC 0060]MEA5612870.1 methyltransferase domain-containing protein [Nodularia spumigena UHCC 0040]